MIGRNSAKAHASVRPSRAAPSATIRGRERAATTATITAASPAWNSTSSPTNTCAVATPPSTRPVRRGVQPSRPRQASTLSATSTGSAGANAIVTCPTSELTTAGANANAAAAASDDDGRRPMRRADQYAATAHAGIASTLSRFSDTSGPNSTVTGDRTTAGSSSVVLFIAPTPCGQFMASVTSGLSRWPRAWTVQPSHHE